MASTPAPARAWVPGEGVQAGDRLVEQEKLGRLGGRQGEGELGPLPAGQRPGPLPPVKAELADAARGELAVPALVEPRSRAQVPGDGKPPVDRRVLGDEANPGELRRGAARAPAQDADLSRVRVEQPGGQLQQGRLARAVRPDQPSDPAGGPTVRRTCAWRAVPSALVNLRTTRRVRPV
jgi:hypothetical protein